MSKFAAWTWLLSTIIAGVIFAFGPNSITLWFIIVGTLVVEPAHQLAPIALGWSNKGFREIMQQNQAKYFLLPLGVFTLAVCLPFWLVSSVYWTWNAYHYGMQNYGTLSLVVGSRHRHLARAFCLLTTSVPMWLLFLPHPHWHWLFVFGAINVFNHWVVDIALSGRVSRYGWRFVAALLVVGSIGFIWYEPTLSGQLIAGVWHPPGIHRRSDSLLQIAMAIGFVHFLYSGGLPLLGWLKHLRMGVWHLSDLQVRKAILG